MQDLVFNFTKCLFFFSYTTSIYCKTQNICPRLPYFRSLIPGFEFAQLQYRLYTFYMRMFIRPCLELTYQLGECNPFYSSLEGTRS